MSGAAGDMDECAASSQFFFLADATVHCAAEHKKGLVPRVMGGPGPVPSGPLILNSS